MQIAGIHAITLTLPRFVDRHIESKWIRIRLYLVSAIIRGKQTADKSKNGISAEKLFLVQVIYCMGLMRQICPVGERKGKGAKLFEKTQFKINPANFFATG